MVTNTNEHQDWINNPNSGFGGMDAYTTSQVDRYKQANQAGDQDLMSRLQADSQRVGYTLPQITPQDQLSKATSPTGTNQSGVSSLGQPLNNYSFIYEQLIRDTMAQQPQRPDQSQYQQQAQQYASLQTDPQRQAIQQGLERAIQQAQEQQRMIEAAYQGVPGRLEQASKEAEKRALESAIARGGGRSGVVDWSNAKIAEEQQRQLGQAEADKGARLANIASGLGLTQSQFNDQLLTLGGREGELAQYYLGNLLDKAYDRDTGDWERQFNEAVKLAGLSMDAQRFDKDYALRETETFGSVQPGRGADAEQLAAATGGQQTQGQVQSYQEGPHLYENRGGQIYKNGVLVPPENYKYIPRQIGGTRVD